MPPGISDKWRYGLSGQTTLKFSAKEREEGTMLIVKVI